MASLSYLRSERDKYINLRGNISQALINLNKAISSFELAFNKIGEAFTVDDSGVNLKLIGSIREELINKKEFLSNKILPAIDGEIERLNREIQAELERIARAQAESSTGTAGNRNSILKR